MAAEDYPIEIDPIYGCWKWLGKSSKDGYPLVTKNGWRTSYAHRHVYTEEVGAIPEGLFLDHLCRNRRCVNPKHLEPVTQRDNERRKSWRRRTRVKKCPGGHDMSYNFTITPQGGKICRECNKTRPNEG